MEDMVTAPSARLETIGSMGFPNLHRELVRARNSYLGALRRWHEAGFAFDAAAVPQHGHRGRVLTSAWIRRTRMVAIEFGMWRSGRAGRSSRSIIVG